VHHHFVHQIDTDHMADEKDGHLCMPHHSNW